MAFQLSDAGAIAKRLLCGGRVLLLCGEPGAFRQQLAERICEAVFTNAEPCSRLSVDLGSPAFGPPAAGCRAEYNGTSWQPVDLEGLATLDAARFRLPLVMAAQRLRERSPAGQACLVEAPAIFRGAAATELLPALAQATGAAAALLLTRQKNATLLSSSLRFPLHLVELGDDFVRLTRSERRAERTALWKAYLSSAKELRLQTSRIDVVSAAVALKQDQAIGRIVALRDGDHRTLALGEICDSDNDLEALVLRTPLAYPDEVRQLLLRDARHTEQEGLVTIPPAERLEPAGTSRGAYTLRPRAEEVADLGPPPGLHSASTTGVLVSGAFGDPLLHLRLPHQRRSLLIDVGDTVRLPARIAHQVSDLFLSHAHFDHFGGFLWLLRSRIGIAQTCRVFGPPDTADRVEAMVRGITWDLVGAEGPRFEVTEQHETDAGVSLQRFIVQAGHRGPSSRPSPGDSSLLLDEPRLIMSATTLDHATPVLAFALQERYRLLLRRDKLRESGLAPGRWLALLHRNTLAGNDDTIIDLPDGRRRSCGELAAELLQRGPGQKLVYATDFADTPQNRQRVIELARDAHTMFCEASYIEADAKLAQQTHHFTARACGEVAAAANVERLVPFHFSRRYEREPEKIYAEVVAAFDRKRVLLPRRIAHAI